MSSPLPVMFLWHLHQPLYRTPDQDQFVLPWVRKHTIREYHDMAEMIERHPEISVTVNWTPVLVQQIQDYAAGDTDRQQALRDRPPGELTPQETFECLADTFKAHPGTIINPHPRFRELKQLWDESQRQDAPADVVSDWSNQEILDCQIWGTLGWFGFSAVQQFPAIKELRTKGSQFNREDKATLRDIETTLIEQCLPRWKSIHDETSVEFSTSPYYHPIGPLLCDYGAIDEAMPGVPKPERRIEWPEDARWHLREARSLMNDWLDLGDDELGLWPSEGSLSESFMELIHDEGFRWTATDEALLKGAQSRDEAPADNLHEAYAWHGELPVFFRNHELSDRIGFDYSKQSTERSLDDFFGTCESIARRTSDRPHRVLSVILDGENPWEYFHDAGESFLSGLYQRLLNSDTVEPVTPSEYLHADRQLPVMERIPAGSWINGDFNIWGGSTLDVRAWDLLAETREALRGWDDLFEDNEEACWDCIHVAQGSDWFWWYGEPFHSADDETFDRLFRGFLLSVYRDGNHPEPSYLHHPLQSSDSPRYSPPRSFVNPDIDGHESHYREWWGSTKISPSLDVGTMAQASERFQAIRFGSNRDTLFGRFDFKNTPPEGTVLILTLNDSEFRMGPLNEGQGQIQRDQSDPIDNSMWVMERICEWKLPMSGTSLEPGTYCQFKVKLERDGQIFDQFPVTDPLSIPVLDRKTAAGEWTV